MVTMFPIYAAEESELLSKLAAIDISVPLQEEGGNKVHREQYMFARMLSTLAKEGQLAFPLEVRHREKPDFSLQLPQGTVGIECVEAVPNDWAHINAIRERESPEALIRVPILKPGQSLSSAEKTSIAKGEGAGSVWVGRMAERQWADAHTQVIAEKTAKLRKGNYAEFEKNWLLVQDNWPVPLYHLESRQSAAELCIGSIQPLLESPAFSRILVGNANWLTQLSPGSPTTFSINDLWG